MTSATLELVSDGIARVASYRDPGGPARDAVVWLHGGNGTAADLLDDIRVRDDIIDVAPQGLLTGATPGWVNPWETDLPRQAPDPYVDLRFLGALEDHVRTKFKSVTRVWLCGFSAGGGLVWSSWALRRAHPHGYAGLSAVGKKLRRELIAGVPWKGTASDPLPFVMVHGALDDPDDPAAPSATHYTWEDSYLLARSVNGNTANEPAVPRHATCCGADHAVHLKVASGGPAPSARCRVDGVGHVWQSCADCHTDDFVIERFRAWGLGA